MTRAQSLTPLLLLSLLAGCAVSTRATSESLQSRQLFVADTRPAESVISQGSPTTSPIPSEDSLPIPLVELRGDSAELGRQHGTALAEQIRTLKTRYLDLRLANSTALKLIAYSATALFEAKMLPEHHAEI